MKRPIKDKYMMATVATHLRGDISRDDPDICVVYEEDDDNYYGNWVTGFGFVGVQFPKATTRDLNAKEIEDYHGRITMLAGGFGPTINLKDEDFRKQVIVTRERDGKVHSGTLHAPIKVGGVIAIITDEGTTFHTSTITSIEGNVVNTRNSTYVVEYP